MCGMMGKGTAQNEKKMRVGLVVKASALVDCSIFEKELHRSIEKCLGNTGIEKSIRADVW